MAGETGACPRSRKEAQPEPNRALQTKLAVQWVMVASSEQERADGHRRAPSVPKLVVVLRQPKHTANANLTRVCGGGGAHTHPPK